jgi:hypothetical protein
MSKSHHAGVYLGIILALATAVDGGTILQYGGGVLPTGGPTIFGQSFTTPDGGPWKDITYNFVGGPALPGAFGTAFLLNNEYLGTPAGLNPAAAGFLATANAADGIYTFPASLILQPATTYYLYSDAFFGTVNGGPGAVAGVTTYFAANPTSNFAPTGGALNFLVAGSVVAASPPLSVPETASFWLVLPALAGVLIGHGFRDRIAGRSPS